MISFSRRRMLAGLAALGSLWPVHRAAAAADRLAPTPAMTEGPFYPERWPATPRRALVAGALQAGVPLALTGTVRDTSGQPVGGARVEIWQCDGVGRYRHSRDTNAVGPDPAFLGFGWVVADAQGQWAFDTIRPVRYPGRTPHIHLAVIAPQRARLVTQIFIDGDPGNAADGLWRWLPQDARERVTMALAPALRAPLLPGAAARDPAARAAAPEGGASSGLALAGHFDVVLRG